MKNTLVILALVLFVGVFAAAQGVPSSTQTLALAVEVPEFVAVDALSSQAINFKVNDLRSGAFTPGDVKPSFRVMSNLKTTRTLTACAYLSGPLTGQGTDTIGTDLVMAKFADGSFGDFGSSTCSGLANSLLIFTDAGATNQVHGSSVELLIHNGATKAPDTYRGTLNIIAQAF